MLARSRSMRPAPRCRRHATRAPEHRRSEPARSVPEARRAAGRWPAARKSRIGRATFVRVDQRRLISAPQKGRCSRRELRSGTATSRYAPAVSVLESCVPRIHALLDQSELQAGHHQAAEHRDRLESATAAVGSGARLVAVLRAGAEWAAAVAPVDADREDFEHECSSRQCTFGFGRGRRERKRRNDAEATGLGPDPCENSATRIPASLSRPRSSEQTVNGGRECQSLAAGLMLAGALGAPVLERGMCRAGPQIATSGPWPRNSKIVAKLASYSLKN